MDNSQIYTIATDGAAAIVTSIVGWIVTAFLRAGAAWLSAHANAQQMANFQEALTRSVQSAIAISKNLNTLDPTWRSQLLNLAGSILVTRFPQTCKAVGLQEAGDAAHALSRVLDDIRPPLAVSTSEKVARLLEAAAKKPVDTPSPAKA